MLPVLVYAQGQDVFSLWGYIMSLISTLTKLVWLLTILTFLWGLVNFMKNAENEKERGNAKEMMKGSIIAFFIAVSFWGMVTFAIKAFDLVPDDPGYLPTTRSN
ncbi:MAG TPA: pilin [Candidatus Paceibacterota bacterium]|nr:pilin [Candidatus Paceibacterota bacterium]